MLVVIHLRVLVLLYHSISIDEKLLTRAFDPHPYQWSSLPGEGRRLWWAISHKYDVKQNDLTLRYKTKCVDIYSTDDSMRLYKHLGPVLLVMYAAVQTAHGSGKFSYWSGLIGGHKRIVWKWQYCAMSFYTMNTLTMLNMHYSNDFTISQHFQCFVI